MIYNVPTTTSNGIAGVMINVFVSCEVCRGFEPRSDQTKDCTFGMCRISFPLGTHYYGVAASQINVSDWNDISTHRLLGQ